MTLHPVVRWLATRGIRWFYRRAEFVGADRIPATGATLLVGSHSNDLTDILLTFMVSKRDVMFVANVSAADSPAVKWTYAGLGVIPIARTRDARGMIARGEDAAALNQRAFASVTEMLRAGHLVAIFPEGVVNDWPHLAPLRTGAARMALEAVASGVTDLTLVPVGFQYECPTQPRSGVVAIVGEGVRVADWKPLNAARAIPEFTHFIRNRLHIVTRNAVTWDSIRQLNEIVAATGAVLVTAETAPIAAAQQVQRAITLVRNADGNFVATTVEPGDAASTVVPHESVNTREGVSQLELLEALEAGASDLTNRLSALGAERWSAADHAAAIKAAGVPIEFAAPSTVYLALSSPLALLGWLWHALPIWVCYALARRTAPVPMEIAARTIVPGLYLMILWYVTIPVLLALAGLPLWIALILLLVKPSLGDFSQRWKDDFRTVALMARVRRAPNSDKVAIVRAAERLRESWDAFKQVVVGA